MCKFSTVTSLWIHMAQIQQLNLFWSDLSHSIWKICSLLHSPAACKMDARMSHNSSPWVFPEDSETYWKFLFLAQKRHWLLVQSCLYGLSSLVVITFVSYWATIKLLSLYPRILSNAKQKYRRFLLLIWLFYNFFLS